jgi:hypothetical protein
VVKDPNARVQEAIERVFRKCQETWSIRQTFKWFHEQGIELPVSGQGGFGGNFGGFGGGMGGEGLK